MKNTKQQITINNKQVTFRYNPTRQCFEANFGFRDTSNVRQSRIVRGKSLDELKTKLIDFAKQVEDNNVFSDTVTLQNYFTFYIKNIASLNNRKSTILNKKALFSLIPQSIKDIALKNLTSIILQKMYSDMSKKYTNNTVKLFHQLINTVLNQAVLNKVIQENPNNLCKISNYKPVTKVYITPTEMKGFLDMLRNNKRYSQIYKPVLFMVYSGCRRGECLGLKKSCIDKENCIVSLQGQITYLGYSDNLKTTLSNRKIKLPRFVIEEITKYDNDSEFVFTNKKGEPFVPEIFYYIVRKAGKECGLNISPKCFRNSYVKTAIMNGIPLKVIQNILGHSKLSTTADIYGTLAQEDTYYTADIMEKALS